MKVFIDTDVILDFLYEREKYFQDSLIIMTLLEKGIFKGYISSLIIWYLFYILSKYIGEKEARKKIKSFCAIINIIPIDSKIIDLGIDSNIKDCEDSVQYFAAKTEGVDIIVTRNKKDYPKGSISIMSPSEFVKSIAANKQ